MKLRRIGSRAKWKKYLQDLNACFKDPETIRKSPRYQKMLSASLATIIIKI